MRRSASRWIGRRRPRRTPAPPSARWIRATSARNSACSGISAASATGSGNTGSCSTWATSTRAPRTRPAGTARWRAVPPSSSPRACSTSRRCSAWKAGRAWSRSAIGTAAT
ncbi:hypothetical protein FV228_17685 [Methylobacterium sp. WL18]|nr:hypothetical protein FV228_17685 [Methylobacterium sp. WL18]